MWTRTHQHHHFQEQVGHHRKWLEGGNKEYGCLKLCKALWKLTASRFYPLVMFKLASNSWLSEQRLTWPRAYHVNHFIFLERPHAVITAIFSVYLHRMVWGDPTRQSPNMWLCSLPPAGALHHRKTWLLHPQCKSRLKSGHFLGFLEPYILQVLKGKFLWINKWCSHDHTKSQKKRNLQQARQL